MRLKQHIYTIALLLAAQTGMAQSLTPVFKDVECGQMLFRQPTTVTVDVRNTSAVPVQIRDVDTGCGCAVSKFERTDIQPGHVGHINLTFDCKQLGHFTRFVRVYDTSSETPVEFNVSGQVVAKIESYSGEYPYKMGVLLADTNSVEFDDVHRGQRFSKEIHILNPTGKNATPVLLRLPSYLQADMRPATLGPKQKGVMTVTLKSKELRDDDYGLIQSSVYLGSNNADRVNQDKEIAVSLVLLPPTVAKDDPSRQYAPCLEMSKSVIDLSLLQQKSKAHDEITITNTGKSVLEIQKLQMFTMGLQVSLSDARIEPGKSAVLRVSAKAKELKRARHRPRVIMITNDPNQQKIVLHVDGVKK